MKFEEKETGTFSEAKTSFSVKNQVTLVLKELCLVKWCHIQELRTCARKAFVLTSSGTLLTLTLTGLRLLNILLMVNILATNVF